MSSSRESGRRAPHERYRSLTPPTNGDRQDGHRPRIAHKPRRRPPARRCTLSGVSGVAARRAHQPPRRLVLDPAVTVAAVPQTVGGSQNPFPALRVTHPEVADRGPELTGIHGSVTPPVDELLIEDLGPAEGIYRHCRPI